METIHVTWHIVLNDVDNDIHNHAFYVFQHLKSKTKLIFIEAAVYRLQNIQ